MILICNRTSLGVLFMRVLPETRTAAPKPTVLQCRAKLATGAAAVFKIEQNTA